MNGKIKTKFAALFAVALMITVCVVPVVGNEDVQAATAAPEGVSGIEIQLFTEDSTDFSDMVYCSSDEYELPETVDPVEWKYLGGLWININEESEYFGKFLRYGQTGLTNEQIVAMSTGHDEENNMDYNWLPLIQTSYMYNKAVDIEIAVTQNGNLKKTETGSTSFEKAGVYFDEVECVSTIKFLSSGGDSNMGFATLANSSGVYEVKVSNNGVLIADEKFSFEYEGDLKTISGSVTDADDANPAIIEGAKIAYTVNGKANFVESDEDGNYEIPFVHGDVVSITSVTYPGDAYTFKNSDAGYYYSYDFGTITDGVSNFDIKSTETTGTLSVKSDSTPISDVEVSIKWWYQYGAAGNYTVDDKAMSKAIPGKVTVLGPSDEDGEVKYTYVDPDFSDVDATAYPSPTAELIATTKNVTGYTFKTVSPDNVAKKSISENVTSDYPGTIVISDSTDVIKSVEDTDTIVVTSLSDVPIVGAEVSIKWWYQYGAAGNYTVVDKSIKDAVAGKVTVLGPSDENGVVKYTYVDPDFSDVDATAYPSPTAELIATAKNVTGYTFKTVSPDNVAKKSISENVTSDYPGTIVISSSNYTLVAEEKSYVITGSIRGIPADKEGEYPEITVKYTNGVGTSTKAIWNGTDGYEYSFVVLEGKSSTITPEFKGYEFDLKSSTIPTATGNDYDLDGPSFTASSTSDLVELNEVYPKSTSLNFTTNGNGEVAKITYLVGNKQYVTPVKISAGKIDLSIYAATDDYNIKIIGAEADGYFAYVGDNGLFGTHETNTFKYYVYNGEVTKPVVGFKFGLYDSDSKLIAELESDITGSATIETDKSVSYILYNGLYMLDAISMPADVADRQCINVSEYANLTPVKVTIQYTASFNVDGDLTSGVGNEYIAAGVDGSNSYSYEAIPGSSIALKAPSIDNFEFVAWMVDGVVVSESADYTLKVDGACQVDALYSAVHYEEPAEGLSMNVLVIGIVILILGILAVAYGIISKKQ